MTISLKIDEEKANLIAKKYQKYQLDNPNEYIIFFAKIKDVALSIFKSNKKIDYSLTLAGKEEKEINQIIKSLKLENYIDKKPTIPKKTKESPKFTFLQNQIGSDEVGTGDFFGPVIVAAALVKTSDLTRIKELGVMDSKKLDDDKIRKIGKILVKEFPYSIMNLDNIKYNEIINKGFNVVKIKTYLHNQALYNLSKKYPEIKHIYVDQFVSSKIYYNYLKDEKNIVKNIYFHQKGETYFPSVALASVIARYTFLLSMDKLNKKYNCTIPFGASNYVETFALNFLKKYGIKEFDKVVKKHFKTYNRVIDEYKKII